MFGDNRRKFTSNLCEIRPKSHEMLKCNDPFSQRRKQKICSLNQCDLMVIRTVSRTAQYHVMRRAKSSKMVTASFCVAFCILHCSQKSTLWVLLLNDFQPTVATGDNVATHKICKHTHTHNTCFKRSVTQYHLNGFLQIFFFCLLQSVFWSLVFCHAN